METQAKTYEPRIVRRVTELWVPHNAGEIAFASPAFGLDTYTNAGKDILNKNLKVPTGDYTASLLHPAYCNSKIEDEPEFENIRGIMESDWLWVFNRNLWNKKGVYVFRDLEAKGRSHSLDINKLEKMLKGGKEINGIRFSNDGIVRFAPKGSYKLGKHTPESFAKDGFIIASCGQEGAEKLGEVSAEFRNKPVVYGVETKTPEQKVSAVSKIGSGLGFDGDTFGCDRCHAFGVLK
jgi:hypothetical protein